MGLSASMYSGTSGLKTHGEGMTVIGNNIANVSTIGFKASTMQFEDALSQSISTAAGIGQVGRGVSVGVVMGDFSQGSLESTTEATDLAIGGNGFFVVSPAGEEINYYTRAGNFRFDKEGFLVDPHGYRLQGWSVQPETMSAAASGDSTTSESTGIRIQGVPGDIKLDNFQSPPQATSRVDMILNVDSKISDKSTGIEAKPLDPAVDHPFTALFDAYDANDPEGIPIGETRYAYQSTIKVYDENGTAHNMTVYMDPIQYEHVSENSGGKRHWEYIIAVPPNEDNREFWADQTDTSKKGILMTGTLTFNAAGEIENMSAFTVNNPYATEPTPGTPDSGTFYDGISTDLTRWTPAHFSQNGYPMCTANFLGVTNGSVTAAEIDPDPTTTQVPTLAGPNKSKNIEINFGVRNKSTSWTSGPSDGSGTTGSITNLAELKDISSFDPTNPTTVRDFLRDIPGLSDAEISALSTTSYARGSTTIFQAQDGYTSGFLQNISVDRDGVITGNYSNGQVLQLFAVTLATFNNNFGLYREGGNLFSESKSSGPPITGLANTGGKGSIASNALEQSNVDLATEFVKMITTEKGFQANSKTITTVDNMLTTLIQIKR